MSCQRRSYDCNTLLLDFAAVGHSLDATVAEPLVFIEAELEVVEDFTKRPFGPTVVQLSSSGVCTRIGVGLQLTAPTKLKR